MKLPDIFVKYFVDSLKKKNKKKSGLTALHYFGSNFQRGKTSPSFSETCELNSRK